MNRLHDETMYFQVLVSEYRMLSEEVKQAAPRPAQVIDELIDAVKTGKQVTWEDLCTFDTALLAFLGRERLLSKLQMVADRYREIAGEKNYASRIRIRPAESDKATEEALRAQIRELLDDLYLHLKLYAGCRMSRNAVLWRILVPMAVLFLGFIAWLTLSHGEIPPIVYVIVSGSIGAMVSMIRRIQNSSHTDTHALTYLDLRYDRLNIYLAPAYGSIFSVVLLLFFSSHLLTGEIFPAIHTMDEELADSTETVAELMMNFVVNTYPATGADCAKLIIWSFIAGFAEKFVPDTLDRLVTRGEKQSEGAKAVKAGPVG